MVVILTLAIVGAMLWFVLQTTRSGSPDGARERRSEAVAPRETGAEEFTATERRNLEEILERKEAVQQR